MRWAGGMALEGPRLGGQTGRIVTHHVLEDAKSLIKALWLGFYSNSFLLLVFFVLVLVLVFHN